MVGVERKQEAALEFWSPGSPQHRVAARRAESGTLETSTLIRSGDQEWAFEPRLALQTTRRTQLGKAEQRLRERVRRAVVSPPTDAAGGA